MKKTLIALVLAAGLTSFAGSAKADIVNLDVSPFSSINGGVAPGNYSNITIATGVSLLFMNSYNAGGNIFTGLASAPNNDNYGSTAGIAINTNSPRINAVPFIYSYGDSIKNTAGSYAYSVVGVGSTRVFTSFAETIVNNSSWYSKGTFTSPDLTSSDYLGFTTSGGNYGWLNVTWSSSNNQFQILGGAYQSVAGVDITAGNTGTAAIPEPSTYALFGLGALALVVAYRRKIA
jgi:hypothetical protein